MKIQEARAKTDAELTYELEQAEKKLFDLRVKGSVESASNPMIVRVTRRTIARVHTVLGERRAGVRGQKSK
jgi:ribosomal protein L29